MQHLDLSDDEAAALTQELHDIVESDRYPLSPRIRTLRAILDKLGPEPTREPLPPIKNYDPPRATAARRRRAGRWPQNGEPNMPLSKEDEDALALTVDICIHTLLRYAVEDDTVTRLMDDIARSIRHSEQICDETGDRDDAVCDEEGAYVEDLIGLSFIVLQTKIRGISSRTLSLNQMFEILTSIYRGSTLNLQS